MNDKTTVDLSAKFKNLDGSESRDSLGRFVSTGLAMATKGDSLKFYSWALDLFKDKSLELDASDFETFKTFIKHNEEMTAILKAQVLAAIN